MTCDRRAASWRTHHDKLGYRQDPTGWIFPHSYSELADGVRDTGLQPRGADHRQGEIWGVGVACSREGTARPLYDATNPSHKSVSQNLTQKDTGA